MPRLTPTTLRPRILALKPAEEASSSRSKSAAVVPDVNTPPNRPPTLQAFRSVLSRTRPVSTHGFHGSRSYLRRHGVQFRRAHISYHKTALAVYLKITANRLRKQVFYNGSAGPNHSNHSERRQDGISTEAVGRAAQAGAIVALSQLMDNEWRGRGGGVSAACVLCRETIAATSRWSRVR